MKQFLQLLSLVLFTLTTGIKAEETSPYLLILGVAQDAGYPQAGCYKPHCMKAWKNPELRRLATSLAIIEPKTKQHFLFEATPDIKEQLYRLHTETNKHSALNGIFITHAHIGHYVGLMHFGHEVMGSKDLPLYTLPKLAQFISSHGPWSQLINYKNLISNIMTAEKALDISQSLKVKAIQVPHRDEYSETAGFVIQGPNKKVLFIPDIDKWEKWEKDIRDEIKNVDYAFIDATFYTHGELKGRDMSKIPHPLVTDSMALFDDMSIEDKAKVYFIHFNHTNPLLDESSKEFIEVNEKGFNVATEGLKISL